MRPPWEQWWVRQQYGELPPADLAGLPRELNPYERFVVRWVFAEWKVALLIPLGGGGGWLVEKYLLHGAMLP